MWDEIGIKDEKEFPLGGLQPISQSPSFETCPFFSVKELYVDTSRAHLLDGLSCYLGCSVSAVVKNLDL